MRKKQSCSEEKENGRTKQNSSEDKEMDGRNKKFIAELQKKPRLRRESGLYIIDGPKMAGEIEPQEAEEIFVTKAFLASEASSACSALLKERPYSVIQDSEMKQISDTVSPQGILVIARQRRQYGIREMLAGASEPLILMLETMQDPGNLGTVLRTAEAAGVSGIIMNRETVDIYSPKVVRSTMGALLRVPFTVAEDLTSAAERLSSGEFTSGRPVRLLAAHLEGAVDYASEDYTGSTCIMIGNESRGLSRELTARADERILIPMCGGTESLNAAVAAAVISFEAARQRRLVKK